MISITQKTTGTRLSIFPEVFILHQPRKMLLELPGKRPFRDTTLMSIYNPSVCLQILENYEAISKELLMEHRNFAEFTHGSTGTKFVLSPKYFILCDTGYDTGFTQERGDEISPEYTDIVSIISVMNAGVWVPLKESYDEAIRQMVDHDIG